MKKKIPKIKLGDGECGRRFRLKNYKSLKNDFEFYFPKFTLLIGPNNSGKSTLNSWFKLLKTDWRNLDPIELENRTFEEVLNRYSQENTIEFTYFLQLNIKKEIEVKLFYKNDNTKTSLGGEELNTGLLDKALIYFDSKPLFEINSYEYFDPKEGKIKIYIKNFIRLLSYKKISILNDNILIFDKYDFEELFFNLEEELKKLKKFPDEIEVILFSGFFRTYNKDKYAHFDLNEIGGIINIDVNVHFQFQIFKLLRGILNGASLNFEKFTSIKKNEDYVTKVNHNEFIGNDILQDFEIIKELTGINLRLLTIKDDNGKFYGHKVQINENNEWVYLDSLGQGYRSFINLLINYELNSNSEASSIKFYFLEEPENTLHPDLIIKFLNLLTDFVNNDYASRNFIIETHSLIILKYFQLAVAKGILKAEDINIYEFSKGDDLSTDVSRKTIDKHGFLSSDFSNGFTNHVIDMEMELWRIQQSLINKN